MTIRWITQSVATFDRSIHYSLVRFYEQVAILFESKKCRINVLLVANKVKSYLYMIDIYIVYIGSRKIIMIHGLWICYLSVIEDKPHINNAVEGWHYHLTSP